MTDPSVKSAVTANLICSASMLLWAAGLPAAQELIPFVPPLLLAAARMALSALFLLPIWIYFDGRRAVLGANWVHGCLVGGSGFALGAYLMTKGQSLTGPVTVAVISASMPVIGIAIEVIADGRRISRGLFLGMVLSLAGGFMVVHGAPGEAGVGLGLGALYCFGSVVAFTLGSRWSVTYFPALSSVGRTTLTLTGAAICINVVALASLALGGDRPDWQSLGWSHAAALGFYAVSGMAISQLLWIFAVGRLGIGLSSLHINATPFYVMLIVFAFGGAWSWAQAASAAIVGLGVLIAQGLIPLPQPRKPANTSL
jgi:drug/metabolite transporter (DMT)-like permease